jgi:cytoskeleton protein RodZ
VEPYSNNEGEEATEEESLGSLLKRCREDHKIELDEAFRATRIRRHTIEAMENDRWDELPPNVFVKGFLRTYAEFLGLDKEKVLDLYEEVPSVKRAKSALMKQVRPKKRQWPLKLVLAILALAFILSIAFLTRKDISIVEKVFQYFGVQETVEERNEETDVREEMDSQAGVDKPEVIEESESAEETDIIEIPAVAEEEPEEQQTPQFDLGDVSPVAEDEPEEQPAPQYNLTAHVTKTTWIAINVDDGPRKEYLFHPGETSTWKANKGFDIIIGNAGGIEFVLNGTEIGLLGAEGKVVRLHLPRTED